MGYSNKGTSPCPVCGDIQPKNMFLKEFIEKVKRD